MNKLLATFALIASTFVAVSLSQSLAPGGPGKDAYWSTAGKQAIGTSASLESKVWFTLAQGVMTEVYYPNVTVANVQTLQFVVVDPKTKKVETEKDDAEHAIKVLRPDSLSFQQINTSRSGRWVIRKSYTSDPASNSILIDVQFESNDPSLNLYVYFDPSMANTGLHDTAISYKHALVAMEADSAVALTFTSKIDQITSGFLGTSDGMAQLRDSGSIANQYGKAENGNVVQMARILQPKRFTTVVSFGKSGKLLG